MKKLLLIIVTLMLTTASFGQCLSVINGSKSSPFQNDRYTTYYYLDGSLDLNNAFDIDKTTMEPKGLDYDIEVGYRNGLFAYYLYYGEYRNIEYQNFGAGVDISLLETRRFDISTGLNVGGIVRGSSPTYFAYAARIKPMYDVSDVIGLYVKGQYQQRPDRAYVHGIFEVSAGLQLRFF